MFKNLKISVKLLVIIVSLSAITILTISYVGIHTAKKSTVANQITMMEYIANLKVDKIESFFSDRMGDIKTVQACFNIKTNLPIVTRFAADRTNPVYIAAKKMLDGQIKGFLDAYRSYVDFMLVSPEDKVVYSANELHGKIDLDNPLTGGYEGEKAFEQGKKGVYCSDIYLSTLEDYTYGMLITAPVHDFDGQFTGVVAFEVNMDPIYEFIQDTTGMGETGETLIAKMVGNEALFLSPLRHDKGAALKRKVSFGGKSALPMLESAQRKNGSGLSIDYRGKDVIAAWRHIPLLDWGLVAKIDLTEALAPVSKLKKVIFGISFFIFIVAIASILWISISITGPVKKLSDTVLKISHGDLRQRVNIESRDEIGLLANSLNMMIGKLVSRDELIKASADYTDNIIKTMVDTLIVVSPDATIKTVNQSALNILGYRKDELIGKHINMIIAEEEVFKGSVIEDLIKKGFISGLEKTYLTKDGRMIPVLFSGSVMLDGHGSIAGIVCVAQDITERKQLDEERQNMRLKMMQSSKLASLGEIATGIAHEINQPLTYINSFIYRLQEDLEDDNINKDVVKDELKTSRSQIVRITSIINHLRTFGRADNMEKEQINIETIFNNTLLLIGERIRLSNIELKKDIESDLPMISGSPTKLEQVFINLFQNAIDAFSEKSENAEIRVNIFLMKKNMQKNSLIKNHSEEKDFVVIQFKDNGIGIENENLEKIFEPFFTTKEVGKGTGLGLSIVHGIIMEHNGTITCESEVYKGTMFTIILPVSASA